MNKTEAILKGLKERFKINHTEEPVGNQLAVDVDDKTLYSLLPFIKQSGWRQLTLITCIDWINVNKFQLVYTFMNWDNGVTLIVRTYLDREAPHFRTITDIYPGAAYYERDVHEFFGVTFEGNPASEKPLFLELWDDIPPMRKDFDPMAYSRRKYPDREYKIDLGEKAGETDG